MDIQTCLRLYMHSLNPYRIKADREAYTSPQVHHPRRALYRAPLPKEDVGYFESTQRQVTPDPR